MAKAPKITQHQRDIFTYYQHNKMDKTAALSLLGEDIFVFLLREAETPPLLTKKIKPEGVHLYTAMVQHRRIGQDRRWCAMGVVLNKKNEIIYIFQTPLVSKMAVVLFMRRFSTIWFGELDAKDPAAMSDIIGGCRVGDKVQFFGAFFSIPWVRWSRDPWELAIGSTAKIEKVGSKLALTKFIGAEKMITKKNKIQVTTEWAKICSKLAALENPMIALKESIK